MKKGLIIFILSLFVVACPTYVYGQKKTSKSKTTKTTKKKGKKTKNEKPAIVLTELPYNSNDCLNAIDLKPDIAYGPTTVPNGGGTVMEIVRS